MIGIKVRGQLVWYLHFGDLGEARAFMLVLAYPVTSLTLRTAILLNQTPEIAHLLAEIVEQACGTAPGASSKL
jgi:hypothetical protein